MNRHKNYHSAMGLEPSIEPRAVERTHRRHREQLRKMIGEYNLEPSEAVQEIATLLRGILEEY